ncbi:Type II toxin-antitoxin system RatA family toxin [Candidatus Bealeia paramacronuclearis]|uniref:Type II toxin-antitoxin system RatA family toxin n=1 Tax=Candidatus Bealeia paramacronuclearis TaxID=1921001 RepID=A0ABZ2C344_9PROT|nr:Type II toxin-antitoxin system RatA family toxin [Candidatus Bealeia paramacronuclearis]
MIQRQESHILPYPFQNLYDLVLDVEKYPEFLPWCLACKIREKGDDFFVADLAVGYKFFRETFRSRVEFEINQKISVEYLSGPFQYLKNEWGFTPLSPTETQVDFMIDFEFKNRFLQKTIQPLFDAAFLKMFDAFSERAKNI